MKKVIVISGGSRGLGKAIAKQLVAKNHVVILARNEHELKKTAGNLGCHFEVCDISDRRQVEKTVQTIIKKFKRIDCLINCAALWIEGELDKNNPEEIIAAVSVNVTGTLLLTRAVIPCMKKQKSGLIINMNSTAGLFAKKERSVYAATKWAMTGCTQSLQQELAPYGIAVTGMYPSKLEFGMMKKTGKKNKVAGAIPLKNIARTVEFILSFQGQTTFPDIVMRPPLD